MRGKMRPEYVSRFVLFVYFQGQLDLAFPVEDPEWYYARGSEYHMATHRVFGFAYERHIPSPATENKE